MKHITLILLILVVRNGGAQVETFNHLTKMDYYGMLFGSVTETDTGYTIIGKGLDTIGSTIRLKLFSIMFNKQGSVVEKKEIVANDIDIDPTKTYCSSDTIFALGEYSNEKALIIGYSDKGDTLFTKAIPNPYYPNSNFFYINGLVKHNNNYFASGTINVDTAISVSGEVVVMRLDSNFNTIWSRHYHATGDTEGANAFIKTVAGNYVVLSTRVGYDTTPNGNLAYNTKIAVYEINPMGTLIRVNNGMTNVQEMGKDIIQTEDGGYLYCGLTGRQIGLNTSAPYVLYQNSIVKLNSTLQEVWHKNFPNELHSENVAFNKLARTSDGNYVVVGSQAGDMNTLDTLDYSTNPPQGYDMNGFLLKFTPQGDSLWGRFYKKIVSPYDEHYLYDVKQTSDGGFILCGEGRDIIVGNPYRGQWGWIVKTDTFGCVVPGCQLTDGLATVPNGLGEALRLAPNPTSSDLWFQLSGVAAGNLKLSIVDMQGRVMEEHVLNGFAPEVQYQLSVAHLPKGAYVLSLSDGKGGLWAEKFVVN